MAEQPVTKHVVSVHSVSSARNRRDAARAAIDRTNQLSNVNCAVPVQTQRWRWMTYLLVVSNPVATGVG